MTKVGVALMCHPRREDYIPGLIEALDVEPLVVWDTDDNRWNTGRRAMLAYRDWSTPATHWLVVQDDGIVCRDLVAGLTEAVKTSGDHPVCLYTGRVRPVQHQVGLWTRRAKAVGSPWFLMQGPWWGVGVVVPVVHIEAMVAYGDEHRVTPNYDLRMARYFDSIKLPCWYTIPSLVEHRHGDDEPSLVPGRTAKNRRAWEFIGEGASALDIDWSVGPPQPPPGGFLRRPRRAPPMGEELVCWDCGHREHSEPRMVRHRRKHDRVGALGRRGGG